MLCEVFESQVSQSASRGLCATSNQCNQHFDDELSNSSVIVLDLESDALHVCLSMQIAIEQQNITQDVKGDNITCVSIYESHIDGHSKPISIASGAIQHMD